ncbi:hypothetical protein IKP85_07230 [bacterium]|nr:hypothetical protein [bacterium]
MVSNIGNVKFSFGSTPVIPAYKPKEQVIIIPFKPMSQEEAYNIQKQREIEMMKQVDSLKRQAQQAGISSSVIEEELKDHKAGEIKVDVKNHAIIIGNPNGDREETTYVKGEVVKIVQYHGNKKFVEEYVNGNRIYTEYEKNKNGQYMKKYYVKTPDTDYYNIIEERSY